MDRDEDSRTRAIKRLHIKRAFRLHLGVYVVASAFFVFIWATTSPGGYFWPMWPIAGWGLGLAGHAWATFGLSPYSEADIQREIEREHRSAP